MKFQVILVRLVRQTKIVSVEASSMEDIDTKILYEEEDGTGWEDDTNWGCEEGTHDIRSQ